MHVQVSASPGDVGGRHLDERHDCEQVGDDACCDDRAGEPGDGSGRAGETAGGGAGRGRWAAPRPRSSSPRAVAGSTGCGTSFPRPRWRSAVTPRARPQSRSPTEAARGSSSSPPWSGRSRFRPASPQIELTATLADVGPRVLWSPSEFHAVTLAPSRAASESLAELATGRLPA